MQQNPAWRIIQNNNKMPIKAQVHGSTLHYRGFATDRQWNEIAINRALEKDLAENADLCCHQPGTVSIIRLKFLI